MSALSRTAVFACVLAMPMSSVAHHSVLPFDGERGTTITGTVTRFLLRNPHTLIGLDVTAPDGRIEHWMIESESPRILERLGWTASSLAHGAHVTVEGAAAKDGSTIMRCREVVLDDGRRLLCFGP